MKAVISFADNYPVTINDPSQYAFASATVRDALGDGRFEPLTAPVPADEAFSPVLAEVPGCFPLAEGKSDVWTRGRDEFAALFDGLELVDPGVAPASEWRPEQGATIPARSDVNVWTAVARKP
jgi:metal-dependent amidase/aminoacylase/carboxypeptidase family protein